MSVSLGQKQGILYHFIYVDILIDYGDTERNIYDVSQTTQCN